MSSWTLGIGRHVTLQTYPAILRFGSRAMIDVHYFICCRCYMLPMLYIGIGIGSGWEYLGGNGRCQCQRCHPVSNSTNCSCLMCKCITTHNSNSNKKIVTLLAPWALWVVRLFYYWLCIEVSCGCWPLAMQKQKLGQISTFLFWNLLELYWDLRRNWYY